MKIKLSSKLKTSCGSLGDDTLSKFKISLWKYGISVLYSGYSYSVFNAAVVTSIRSWPVLVKGKTSLCLAVQLTALELLSLLCG